VTERGVLRNNYTDRGLHKTQDLDPCVITNNQRNNPKAYQKNSVRATDDNWVQLKYANSSH